VACTKQPQLIVTGVHSKFSKTLQRTPKRADAVTAATAASAALGGDEDGDEQRGLAVAVPPAEELEGATLSPLGTPVLDADALAADVGGE
jgi:hypothetical protein